MQPSSEDKLVVATTASTMFDLDAAQQVSVREGLAAYREYQREREYEPLGAGLGMPLVRALLGVVGRSEESLVELVVASPDDGESGARILNSVEQWSLPITRLCFTGGRSSLSYLASYATDLFLSAEPSEVSEAIRAGHGAARVPRSP